MSSRRHMNRLFYFTVEEEGILAEAFSKFEHDVFAVTYKVAGTEDVFVTTGETKAVQYTVVGEVTAGAANPGRPFPVGESPVRSTAWAMSTAKCFPTTGTSATITTFLRLWRPESNSSERR